MIGAFILSTGQETEGSSIASIAKQVKFLRIIKQRPVNRSINLCFRLAEEYKLTYFVILGADTIHYEHSIKTMAKYMTDKLWCVMGKLDDYYRGSDSYGNHLYNAKALKGYRVDESDPLYDHAIHADMDKKGFKKVLTKEIIGKHHPMWTTQEAFEKHLFSGKRYKDKDFRIYYNQVKKRHTENPCEVNRAAYEGFKAGIGNKPKPLIHSETPEWKKVKHLFKQEKLIW